MTITVGRLGRVQKVNQRAADLIFSFESSDLVMTAVLPNVIRHTWVPTHWRLYTEPVRAAHAAVRRYWPAGPSPIVREASDKVYVEVGDFLLEATRDPFRLRYCTADGCPVLEEVEQGGLSWSYWDYSLRYVLSPDDHFYGMGQADQLSGAVPLDHRGQLREVWNQHSPPAVTIFPAVLSLRGYALLVDNPSRASWDLGHTDRQSFSYQARGGGLEYYVVLGPGMPRLLQTMLELTGYAPLPPRWALGLLQSRYGYRNRQELESIAQTFRARQLPCDGLILDVFWFREMGDLAFDSQKWPDAPEMIARLKHQGFRTIVIEEPYLTRQSRNYPEALSRGYLARRYDGSPYTFNFWPGECGLFDFSNPAAREWWTKKHRPLIEMGIDGWWTDLNEPAKHLQDMAQHDGPAAAVHNLTSLWMQQSVYEAHQQFAPDHRPFILSRAAFPGSQRYGAALWSGDVDKTFASLRKQVAVGLSVGLTGIPLWGSDIGGFGFGGECTGELYARWFEFSAFCPLCRPHGDQKELREPWQFGAEIEAICRKYLEMRYRLLPYIYNAARDTCTTGIPIMRPLVLEYPADPQVLNMADEYLFGPDILVAPMLEQDALERSVYLPQGNWIDYWSEEIHVGQRFITSQAKLDKIPLFIRQGAIIPTGPQMQYSAQYALDPLTLEIYRGADRSLTLYEDDGKSNAYQNGECAETRFEIRHGSQGFICHLGETNGKFTGCVSERTIILNIHLQTQAETVTCDDAPVPALKTSEALSEASAGWFRDQRNQILSIKLSPANTARTVRVA
jgi:alpha-glucosidase (family GH31 glycosyl hydrolase)